MGQRIFLLVLEDERRVPMSYKAYQSLDDAKTTIERNWRERDIQYLESGERGVVLIAYVDGGVEHYGETILVHEITLEGPAEAV